VRTIVAEARSRARRHASSAETTTIVRRRLLSSRSEPQTAFDDALGGYYPDTLREDRFILIGYSERRRLLYVVHAEVKLNTIRIISARKATKHEKAHHEND
jgi:uncharacterized protein